MPATIYTDDFIDEAGGEQLSIFNGKKKSNQPSEGVSDQPEDADAIDPFVKKFTVLDRIERVSVRVNEDSVNVVAIYKYVYNDITQIIDLVTGAVVSTKIVVREVMKEVSIREDGAPEKKTDIGHCTSVIC